MAGLSTRLKLSYTPQGHLPIWDFSGTPQGILSPHPRPNHPGGSLGKRSHGYKWNHPGESWMLCGNISQHYSGSLAGSSALHASPMYTPYFPPQILISLSNSMQWLASKANAEVDFLSRHRLQRWDYKQISSEFWRLCYKLHMWPALDAFASKGTHQIPRYMT